MPLEKKNEPNRQGKLSTTFPILNAPPLQLEALTLSGLNLSAGPAWAPALQSPPHTNPHCVGWTPGGREKKEESVARQAAQGSKHSAREVESVNPQNLDTRGWHIPAPPCGTPPGSHPCEHRLKSSWI